MGEKKIHILSVEDNPGDRLLIRKFLTEGADFLELHFAHDGSDALDFLQRRGRFSGAERPDLILLDLNLPKKDGREVLSEIKLEPALKDIPVFIFTTSKSSSDSAAVQQLGAERFISKPSDIDAFRAVMRDIREWLQK